MSYIDKYIFASLKHADRALFINEITLRDSIWYSSTQESYAQRTDIFDNTWLSSSRSDDFVLLALKSLYKLQIIKVFKGQNECHKEISLLDDDKENCPLLFLYKTDGTSAFTAYISGLRNALAHGTFNKQDNRTFFISQHRAKQQSEIKFFLQSMNDCTEAIINALGLFNSIASGDDKVSKYDCIQEEFDLIHNESGFYSRKYNCVIVINDEFKFSTNKHINELQELMSGQSFDGKVVILIDENIGNITLNNRTSPNGNLVVIPQNRLIEHFGIQIQ